MNKGGPDMLEGIIISKTTRKILTLFVANPDSRFYIRQLERILNEPVSAVRRQLQRLYAAGILLAAQEANLKYYQINKNCPIFEEIKDMILKTQGIGDRLRELINNVPDIKAAFIYGSVAKHQESASSDIDLMVIGDIDTLKLHSAIRKIENKLKRAINYSLMRPDDLKNKKSDFIKRVLKEKKIFLIGDKYGLQRFNQRR